MAQVLEVPKAGFYAWLKRPPSQMWQQTKYRVDDLGKPTSDWADEILMIDEVAAHLKVGKRTVYRLAANGKLPAFKLGGTWRFRRAELDQWIASRIGKVANDDTEGGEE